MPSTSASQPSQPAASSGNRSGKDQPQIDSAVSTIHVAWETCQPKASSFVEEVWQMLNDYRKFRNNTPASKQHKAKPISLGGSDLSIAQVTAISQVSAQGASLDPAVRSRVERSAAWITEQVMAGADIYGVTTGFGANCHMRTTKTEELQVELIRFLNAAVTTKECLPVGLTRAAMVVRANALLQGFSGIRWEVIAMVLDLVNYNLIPRLPFRGSITASGDLVPLSYLAAALTGRSNSRVTTENGTVITGVEALQRMGYEKPVRLQAKEGLALCNGTAVAAAAAALVCFDASMYIMLEVILSAMFCEVMLGDTQFVDPLIHKLRGQPGQIEAAAIMKYFLDSSFVERGRKLRHLEFDPMALPLQDRYALRTAPQWLGPQLEVIRAANQTIQRELNAVTDNPLIDPERGLALNGGNFQGTPIGVSMDNLRIALAAVGKLVFAQFSELVCGQYNNGLPDNLAGGEDLSLDMGFKGVEITMASYCSELQFLANPVTSHVQSAEQHNQDVNSLGLISAQKCAEAIVILKQMFAAYLVALCQAMDLRKVSDVPAGLHPTQCRTYPVYHFVRTVAATKVLKGDEGDDQPCPGDFIEKVHDLLDTHLCDLVLGLVSDLACPTARDFRAARK